MQNLYLKFSSRDEANQHLLDSGGNNKFRNTDVIGVIYRPTGETVIKDDFEQAVMQAINGWHVNVLVLDEEDSSSLLEFVTHPMTPIRIWG